MEIQRDISIMYEKNKVIAVETPDDANFDDLRVFKGYRSGKEIYQPPLDFVNAISTYCHEVGHVLGDKLSFQSGLQWWNRKNVLSFDEIMAKNICITLDGQELDYARKYVFRNRELHIKNEVLSISQKILNTFFKGRFDKNEVVLHNVSYRKLNKLVAEGGSSTFSASDEDGSKKIVNVNSKHGRNSELPSIYTEAASLLILENTLIKYKVVSDSKYVTMSKKDSAPHQRAQNIVSRAHSSKGWRIPSTFDINSR